VDAQQRRIAEGIGVALLVALAVMIFLRDLTAPLLMITGLGSAAAAYFIFMTLVKDKDH
jgi:hypothetical protein